MEGGKEEEEGTEADHQRGMVGGERQLWVIWMKLADDHCPPLSNAKGLKPDTTSTTNDELHKHKYTFSNKTL